jgi:hypothetical protein
MFKVSCPRRRSLVAMAGLALAAFACSGPTPSPAAPALDAAAESYVRLVLALGERDRDSLDSYHGPPEWQADARKRHVALPDIRAAAASLAATLASSGDSGADIRRAFLIRQLRAVAARIDVLRGARPPFAEEARDLFGLAVSAEDRSAAAPVRAELDRLLPGTGGLSARYAAFDRRFLIAPNRLDHVLSSAIEGCRAATRVHVTLPPTEHVNVEYARDLPWSAFTRYQGSSVSQIQVNAALPLTVDRALDLACHEAYPGHHTIDSVLDARSPGHVEFLVRPLFSPQSLLHEAAASLAPALAFPEPARLAFERDVLFPLAGLDPAGAELHVQVGRLVDRLSGVQASIAQRYLDGMLDFSRAAAALEQEALMPSPDAVLKFLNQFRSYAATYTLGRNRLRRHLDVNATAGDNNVRWRVFLDAISNPAQILPPDARLRQ